jgi:hypothetical protein
MQLLRDNLTLWTSDLADAAKDENEGKDLWALRWEKLYGQVNSKIR